MATIGKSITMSEMRKHQKHLEDSYNCPVCLEPSLRILFGWCQHRVCSDCAYSADGDLLIKSCPICLEEPFLPKSKRTVPDDTVELLKSIGLLPCEKCDSAMWVWGIEEHKDECEKKKAEKRAKRELLAKKMQADLTSPLMHPNLPTAPPPTADAGWFPRRWLDDLPPVQIPTYANQNYVPPTIQTSSVTRVYHRPPRDPMPMLADRRGGFTSADHDYYGQFLPPVPPQYMMTQASFQSRPLPYPPGPPPPAHSNNLPMDQSTSSRQFEPCPMMPYSPGSYPPRQQPNRVVCRNVSIPPAPQPNTPQYLPMQQWPPGQSSAQVPSGPIGRPMPMVPKEVNDLDCANPSAGILHSNPAGGSGNGASAVGYDPPGLLDLIGDVRAEAARRGPPPSGHGDGVISKRRRR